MSTEQLAPRAVAEEKLHPPAFRFGGGGQAHVDTEDWAEQVLRSEDPDYSYDRAIFMGDCRGKYLPDGTLIAAGDWIIRQDGRWWRSVNGRTPAHARLVERVEYAIEKRDEPDELRRRRFHGELDRLRSMLADSPHADEYRIIRIDVTEVVTEVASESDR